MTRKVSDLKEMLNPRDRRILDDQDDINWVPEEPRELLLPYIEEDEEPERDSLEFRRKKAKDVYDGYGKIIEECKEVEEEISGQCKNTKVILTPEKHYSVMAAVKRVFGTNGTEITFEMYQACIRALGEISGNNIPDIKNLEK